MAELRQVWKELFGSEIGDDGLPAERKAVSFAVYAPGRARESDPLNEEYEEYLRKMMLRLEDLCPECREKAQGGAVPSDLDVRCSKLARAGIRTKGKK